MTITVSEIFWLMIAASFASGAMIIGSAFVTGYLVFRAKRETHEMLLGPSRKKHKGPVIIDEFEAETKKDDENVLPSVIAKMNERLGAQLAKDGPKVKHG